MQWYRSGDSSMGTYRLDSCRVFGDRPVLLLTSKTSLPVPNLGDMTKLYQHEICNKTKLDLLVCGTPCKSFSTAGLRHGLDDECGDLALQFIRLVSVCQPEYFLWENVPGVLSIDQGRAFQRFTNDIRKCGYGFAYRVVDAQRFGVPQQRRRVYLVGHRDYRCAVQVLFEPEVLCGKECR